MNKRDAINEILLSLNELPLDIDDLVEDVKTAVIVEKELDIARKKILAKGWYFNTITRKLAPNTNGNIIIPNTFLSVNGGNDNPNLVVRDWKLFDKSEMSYIFESEVTVTVIEDIIFDDIIFTVADYIVQMASLRAYINIIGNSEDVNVRREEINSARLLALREDANNRNGNVLDSTFVTTMLDKESL